MLAIYSYNMKLAMLKNSVQFFRILRKFAEAAKDPSGRSMKELFQKYLECGEDWMSSSIVLEEKTTTNETTGGRFGWLSKAESRFNNFEDTQHQLVFSKNS